MNEIIRKFRAVIRFNWQGELEYRSYFLFWAFIDSLPFLIMFFLWRFIYTDQSIVAGYDLSQMITYYFLVFVIERLASSYMDWNLAMRIKDGQFAQFMYRPLPHRLYYLATSTAQRVTRIFITTPVIILGALIFRKYLIGTTAANVVPFLAAIILAWAISYLLGYVFGYFAFWMEKANAVLYFRWSLVYYLSGQFLPLNIFGATAYEIIKWLPFRYIIGFPIEIYLSKFTASELYLGFGIGLFWVAALFTIERIMYARGIKKFKAVGN